MFKLWKSDDILNINSLLGSKFVSQNMRFYFPSQDISLNKELKSWNIFNSKHFFDHLYGMNHTLLSSSSSS